ncbi:MAG: hypothetical protein IPK82_19515 [Polyangiaceae bacterium]|nr:hypothetical protein [Polyangiaceae bacterium]
MKKAAQFIGPARGPAGQPARTITHSPNVFIGQRLGSGSPAAGTILYHIHVDADRDGVADADWRNADRWDFQRRGLGAVVLPYLNTDKPRRAEDIAPLTIRRDPATAGRSTAGWRGELWADHPYKLTLLSGTSASAVPLTDPLKNPMIQLDLSKDEIELGMEATQHPGPYLGAGRDPDPRAQHPAWVFEGLVKLILRLFDPSGKMTHVETALVRVAPWVAFNHFDPTDKVYISTYGLGQDIRDKMALISPSVTVEQVNSGDQWTQDQGEPGFTNLPSTTGAGEGRLHLLELKNSALHDHARPTMTVVESNNDEAERIDEKKWKGVSPGRDSIDFGGNVECVPPFVHPSSNRVYSLGRLYYGNPVADSKYPSNHRSFYGPLRRFFDSQAVQDPFTLDSGWLNVGHVDEVVTCLPMKDARLGFRVLIASHDLALQLCDPIADNTPAFGPYAGQWREVLFAIVATHAARNQQPSPSRFRAPSPLPFTVTTGFLKGKTPYNVVRYDFLGNAPAIRQKLSSIRADFTREVGLLPDDFIELPVLFQATPFQPPPAAPTSLNAVAFTPGVVNGLVITRGDPEWSADRNVTFIVPKPFGPALHPGGRKPTPPNECVFEEYIRNALGPASKTGVHVVFADDFMGYHVLDGEVHCGTNSIRVPPKDRRFWAPREDTRRKTP